jgi:hypothetical protein
MSDEAVAELFAKAIESFPLESREAARRWLAKRERAHRLILEIQTKGLGAFLRGGD